MAFADNTATLYFPIAGSAGSSQWGSDVRKLLDTADGTGDSTTICNLGTGGTVTRTCDPYTTSTADLTEADYGWAVNPSDMNSVSGARRFYEAADHVLTGRTSPSAAFTTETKNLIFRAWRVASAGSGRTRTLLGSVTVAMNAVAADVTATLALPEIIFEPDETIQYGCEMNAGGLAVVGRTVTFFTGTMAGTAIRVDTPPLQTLASTIGSAVGTSTVAAVMAAIGVMVGSASGLGDATAAGGSVATTVGTASGVGTATPVLAGINTSTGSAVGTSTVAGATAAVGSMVGSSAGVGTADGVMSRILATAGASAGVGAAAGAMAATGAMVGSAAGTSTVSGSFGAVSETTGTAAGVGTASGSFAVVAPTVGTVEIGAAGSGEIIVRPVFQVSE